MGRCSNTGLWTIICQMMMFYNYHVWSTIMMHIVNLEKKFKADWQ